MVIEPSSYRRLPTAEELPSSDETPVDNQLQNDIPNLLLLLLGLIWASRDDWYFGVDMGVYYDPDQPAIVPDGFLATGVQRHTGERGRLSYVIWQELVPPILALEVVSEKYGDEYEDKLANYESIGILYYAVYNPFSGRRGRHKHRQRLEIYKLRDGKYELLPTESNQIWLPEIGLGLGYEVGAHIGWQREWLYWYDEHGVRYPTYEEITAQAQQARLQAEEMAERERQQKEKLLAHLKALGINSDEI